MKYILFFSLLFICTLASEPEEFTKEIVSSTVEASSVTTVLKNENTATNLVETITSSFLPETAKSVTETTTVDKNSQKEVFISILNDTVVNLNVNETLTDSGLYSLTTPNSLAEMIDKQLDTFKNKIRSQTNYTESSLNLNFLNPVVSNNFTNDVLKQVANNDNASVNGNTLPSLSLTTPMQLVDVVKQELLTPINQNVLNPTLNVRNTPLPLNNLKNYVTKLPTINLFNRNKILKRELEAKTRLKRNSNYWKRFNNYDWYYKPEAPQLPYRPYEEIEENVSEEEWNEKTKKSMPYETPLYINSYDSNFVKQTTEADKSTSKQMLSTKLFNVSSTLESSTKASSIAESNTSTSNTKTSSTSLSSTKAQDLIDNHKETSSSKTLSNETLSIEVSSLKTTSTVDTNQLNNEALDKQTQSNEASNKKIIINLDTDIINEKE